MKVNVRRRRSSRSSNVSRRLVTTLGELISAAYEVVPGIGDQRIERALQLLERSPLARSISPHVEFVR